LAQDVPNAEDGPAAPEAGPIAGLTRSAATLLATLAAIVQTRLELLSTELQQEVHRVAEITMWTLVALLSAWMGLLFLALAIISLFWDTHRLLATAAVTAFFVVLALGALMIVRSKVRSRPPLLEATLTELAKDRDKLSGKQR
jgi:uncharacterized membrane protein YqjE